MPDLPDRISEWLLLLVKSQRSVAHLLISNELVLIQAGGELEYYGLGDLEHGDSASDQLPFLEGLLPLAETPFLFLLNKTDLKEDWDIPEQSVEDLKNAGHVVLQTSAKTGEGVEEAFQTLAQRMVL